MGVLVVGDEETARNLLQRTLEGAGYNVVVDTIIKMFIFIVDEEHS